MLPKLWHACQIMFTFDAKQYGFKIRPDRIRQNQEGRSRARGHKFQKTEAGAGAGFTCFKEYMPGLGQGPSCDNSKYRCCAGRGLT